MHQNASTGVSVSDSIPLKPIREEEEDISRPTWPLPAWPGSANVPDGGTSIVLQIKTRTTYSAYESIRVDSLAAAISR